MLGTTASPRVLERLGPAIDVRPLDLTLVIPCYNEAKHLEANVGAILEVLEQTRYSFEIIFVDDCSRDETREVILSLCRTQPQRCRYVFHERNLGRGGAFKTGFSKALGRIVGFIDVDLEVHAHYIPALVNLIDKHSYDVSTGYRQYQLTQWQLLHRYLLSYAYRRICRGYLGLRVRDSETGCKFFNAATARDAVMNSESNGWFWDTEVMLRTCLHGLKVHELPVYFMRNRSKSSTVRLVPDICKYLVSLYRCRSKVGLGLGGRSPIYWSARGYDLSIRLAYGRRNRDRILCDVAAQIPDGSSVVDLCGGTGLLYREFLQKRGCRYLMLDSNGRFVLAAQRRNIPSRLVDLNTVTRIPRADYVVMTSSFFHFMSRADDMFNAMRSAAQKGVIISEPVKNVSSHRFKSVAALGQWISNPGCGEHRQRFNLESFREFCTRHQVSQFQVSADGANALAVFKKTA